MITATINDEGAQLYVVMKGAPGTVGKVEDSYKPHHVAIRCSQRARPLVRKFLTELHKKGYWQELTKLKTTRAVHIRLSDVRTVLEEVKDLKELQ